jgi:hypothetical protein
MQEIDPDQVVDATWHYDGPHDPETVTSAAQALPRLVRYLNNATRPGKASLRYAPMPTGLPASSLRWLIYSLRPWANSHNSWKPIPQTRPSMTTNATVQPPKRPARW